MIKLRNPGRPNILPMFYMNEKKKDKQQITFAQAKDVEVKVKDTIDCYGLPANTESWYVIEEIVEQRKAAGEWGGGRESSNVLQSYLLYSRRASSTN